MTAAMRAKTSPRRKDLVKKTVDYVTVKGGGQGAVREICEMLLMSQGYWTEVADRYDFTDLL